MQITSFWHFIQVTILTAIVAFALYGLIRTCMDMLGGEEEKEKAAEAAEK